VYAVITAEKFWSAAVSLNKPVTQWCNWDRGVLGGENREGVEDYHSGVCTWGPDAFQALPS